MRVIELLASIGRLPPEAWDAIIPKWDGRYSRYSAVALNPQPLPPVATFVVSAAQMAHDVARGTIEAQIGGGAQEGFFGELIDDWCGTPWPRKWPWPWPGPRVEGPHPDPWQVNLGRIIGAIVFTSYGTRLGQGELSKAFIEGAERLAEASMSEGARATSS